MNRIAYVESNRSKFMAKRINLRSAPLIATSFRCWLLVFTFHLFLFLSRKSHTIDGGQCSIVFCFCLCTEYHNHTIQLIIMNKARRKKSSEIKLSLNVDARLRKVDFWTCFASINKSIWHFCRSFIYTLVFISRFYCFIISCIADIPFSFRAFDVPFKIRQIFRSKHFIYSFDRPWFDSTSRYN